MLLNINIKEYVYKLRKDMIFMPKELTILLIVIGAAVVTLLYVYVLFHKVSKIKIQNKKIDEVHQYIHKGALTFLISEYMVIIPFVNSFKRIE